MATLSISLLGTLAGLGIGQMYEYRAQILYNDAHEEIDLLKTLDYQLIQAQLHQRQLDSLVNDPEQFSKEYRAFQQFMQSAQQAWQDVQTTYQASEGSHEDPEVAVIETDDELALISHLIEHHQDLLPTYQAQINQIIENRSSIEARSGKAEFQKILLDFESGQFTIELAEFSEEIQRFIETVSEEVAVADGVAQQAQQLRMKVLLASMVGSIAIAILAALLTSRTITRPLQETTEVAQRVIQEANFDLQVPVSTQDEVGDLAQALNELIQSVKQLLIQQSQAEAQLVHAEKMSSLGQLVAGIAHEVNNPVNFIHGNLQPASDYAQDLLNLIALYQKHYPQPVSEIVEKLEDLDLDFLQKDFLKLLQSMQVGTQRIREIVLSLRNFSRLDEADVKKANLHEGLENTLLILSHRLKPTADFPGIQIIKDYGDLPIVDCFPGQLNQVFMNIIANSIDALENTPLKAGTLPSIWLQTDCIDKDWVAIRIRDNGPGIAPAVLKKLFDPFFTTKPVGKGTGLGLSISYQIITEKHHGKLVCQSTVGEGTEFIIEIPRQQSIT